jgi:hypothetical protein
VTIIAFDVVTRRLSTAPGVPAVGVPPRPVMTSLLFPIEIVESMDVGANLARGEFWDTVGALDVASDLASGSLVATIAYKTAEPADVNGLDVAADLASGSLTVVIAYKTAEPADINALDVASDLAAGSLVVVITYVDHTIPPEGLDVSSDLVSGSLA